MDALLLMTMSSQTQLELVVGGYTNTKTELRKGINVSVRNAIGSTALNCLVNVFIHGYVNCTLREKS